MNPLDDKNAALITIDSGSLKVEGIRNDDPSNLKKSKLGWNGKMSTKLQTFIELAAGGISQRKFFKMVAKRQIKVRGLMYFLLLQKLVSFLPNSKEPKPKYIDNRKKPLIATKLFMISGFLNMII